MNEKKVVMGIARYLFGNASRLKQIINIVHAEWLEIKIEDEESSESASSVDFYPVSPRLTTVRVSSIVVGGQ